MTLAISSYAALSQFRDSDDVLNLAWTIDERAFLTVDLDSVASNELAEEARSGLPFMNHYFVDDPYGDAALRPAVAAFFRQDVSRFRVTCGAGVNSLLYAVARLAGRRPVYVAGDVYPDLPHWIAQSGGICVSGVGPDRADVVRAHDAGVVLIDRPALIGDDLSHSEIRRLCSDLLGTDVIIVVDESYANYCHPSSSAVSLACELPNIIVLRGLSKAYWLGGLRIGYCVASANMTELIRCAIPPMLASSLSLRIARAALELGDICDPLRQRIVAAKREMTVLLEGSPLEPVPTSCYVPYVFHKDANAAARFMEERGILGKSQPFWSGSRRAVRHVYRLSVPLIAERMGEFRRRLDR